MAGYISNETIDRVLDATDIVSVIADYTKLTHRSANDWWGCCPFHGEKTASFHVDSDKKFFHCFGCHKGGNVISFVMEMEKISYVQAVSDLAKKSGIEVKYKEGFSKSEDSKKNDEIAGIIELYERTASMFNYFLLETPQGKDALDYITSRGITKDTIEKFKIGYAPSDRKWLRKFLKSKNFSDSFLDKSGLFSKKYPEFAFFSDRLMFPIFNRNSQVVAFGGRVLHPRGEDDPKYINSGEMIQYKKRETLYAFNFAKNAVRENKAIIFCEGYMDCIAYHQCKINYAVAPLGTALTEEQIKMIRGFVETVYLSFDSDGAGQNATLRAILMCRKLNLSVRVIIIRGGKDPAEIMQKYGAENLTSQVKNAILDSDYLLNKLGKEYPVDTPEGKTKASLEFFQYVDSLQSDIQKESSLEQLAGAFNLKPEAVKRDFENRNLARERTNIRQTNNHTEQENQIKLDAQLRGLIAVAADLNQFKILQSELTEEDFSNPYARKFYKVLESCFSDQVFSLHEILDRCNDEQMVALITEAVSSGAYQSEKVGEIIRDTISFVKRKKLEDQRDRLKKRIGEFVTVTDDDRKMLDSLILQKQELDIKIRSLGK